MIQSNLNNRTIFCCDNLEILQGINSDSIDLIYLDPPFNKKKVFTAPIGSSAEGAEFSDIFLEEDVKDEWLRTIKEDADKIYHLLESVKHIEGRTSYNFCYLAYMAIRLLECRRVLKSTGSLYLHCDPTMSHYLKILLDCVFGEHSFRNEIIWCYSRPSAPKQKQLSRVHDVIFWYAKGETWTFNFDAIRQPYADSSRAREGYSGSASKVALGNVELHHQGKFPESWIYIPPLKGNAKEATGYPTQKPLALLERFIKASSNEGDVVLDPFCGCATTCIAAERLNRQWIGVDVSVKAYELVRQRLGEEVEWKDTLFEEDIVTFQTHPPQRTDRGADDRPQKYVYIISHKNFENEYKVGVASDVKKRLGSYQTGDPERQYQLKYQLLTPHFREIEERIHEIYENKHEWVSGDLTAIKKSIEAYHDECEESYAARI